GTSTPVFSTLSLHDALPIFCTLYDVGPNYLVMELLDGSTLSDLIKQGPLAAEKVARYGAQIAAALAEAHAHGVVHRDLKPGNIRSEEHTSELQSRSDLVCRL